MTARTLTLLTIPAPLAVNARQAAGSEGDCAICRQRISRGQRIATLPDASTAHTGCIGSAAQ